MPDFLSAIRVTALPSPRLLFDYQKAQQLPYLWNKVYGGFSPNPIQQRSLYLHHVSFFVAEAFFCFEREQSVCCIGLDI